MNSDIGQDSIKIVVLGVGTVGKSSLTLRFNSNQYTEEYVPTLQDTFRKNIILDNKPAQLEIVDTAGQEDYRVMQDLWIKEGKGFILVFSLVHQDSLKELQDIYNKIELIKGKEGVPIVVVGNKSDLERNVSQEEGQSFANAINARYVETSAKTGKNCNLPFEQIVRSIWKQQKPQGDSNKQQGNKKRSFFDKYCTLI